MRDRKNEKIRTGWHFPHLIGATASFITGGLFLVAAIDFILTGWASVRPAGWLSGLQNNWLVVIFKLLSGFGNEPIDRLKGVNALDIIILLLVGITLFGLFTVLRIISRVWPLVALALPFLGLVVFLVTQLAGRSGVMAAMIIISAVMLHSSSFSRTTAWLGIVAGLLLLAGDFSVSSSFATIVAPFFGLGYLFLVAWFFLIGFNLLQLGRIQRIKT